MDSYRVSFFLCALVSLVIKDTGGAGSSDDYWKERDVLLGNEKNLYIGSSLKLDESEMKVNDDVMTQKNKIINEGYKDVQKFPPAQNFMKVVKEIVKSPMFQIIRKMPKGAVLHVHDLALTSATFVLNITYYPDLYVCEDKNELKMQFFKNPPQDCNWVLLSNLRKNTTEQVRINKKILRAICMDAEDPDATYPNVDKAWEKFDSIFIHLIPMLTYKPVFEDYIYQGLQELYDDNVMYVELRATLLDLCDLDGNIYGPVETARILKEISARFVRKHPDFQGMKLIYSPIRKVDQKTMDHYITTALEIKTKFPSFVVGFDLVGQEDKGEPLSAFVDQLQFLGTKMRLFFHAGETNWNGLSTDLNLFDAILLNTTRIGHGYAVLKHPVIMTMIKEKNIAIEVNPISNQVLGLVKDLRNHPASILFSLNYPVAVSCDDPGLWNAKGLSYDFYEAFIGIMSREADLRSLKQLAMNSILFSSLDGEEKQKASGLWTEKWKSFIRHVEEELHPVKSKTSKTVVPWNGCILELCVLIEILLLIKLN